MGIGKKVLILYRLLPTVIKIRTLCLLVLLLLTAGFEALSTVSLYPLTSNLLNGSSSSRLAIDHFVTGVQLFDDNPLVYFISLLLLSTLLRVSAIFVTAYVATNISNYISAIAFEDAISRDYKFFLENKEAELINSLFANLIDLNNSVIYPCFSLLNSIFSSIIIFVAIFAVNPGASLVIISLLSSLYIVISIFVRRSYLVFSKKMPISRDSALGVLSDAISNIKNIKIDSLSAYYVSEYSRDLFQYRSYWARGLALSQFPKYVLEFSLFAIIIAYVYVIPESSKISFFPYLSVLLLGMIRMLPSIQSIFGSWSSIKTHSFCIDSTMNMIQDRYKHCLLTEQEPILGSYSVGRQSGKILATFATTLSSHKRVHNNNKLKLLNVDKIGFAHKESQKYLFRNLSFCLDISSGANLCITGSSGSGKSTLMDILSGLLKPSEGVVSYSLSNIEDSFDVSCTTSVWEYHNEISYVSQKATFFTSSILSNIHRRSCSNTRLDIDDSVPDIEFINYLLEKCALLGFVRNLPEGLNTVIGHGGHCLSGGQEQRLALVRALYKNPSLLFLDESTSALDRESESTILQSLVCDFSHISLLAVSHKPSFNSYFKDFIDLDGHDLHRS